MNKHQYKDFISNPYMLCKEFGCSKRVKSYGLCLEHYNHCYKKYQKSKECTINECEKPQYCKGLCKSHYKNSQKCIFEDSCKKKCFKDSLCKEHYFLNPINSKCSIEECNEKIKFVSALLCEYHYYKIRYDKNKKRKIDHDEKQVRIDKIFLFEKKDIENT
jgi:hypothetical protein